MRFVTHADDPEAAMRQLDAMRTGVKRSPKSRHAFAKSDRMPSSIWCAVCGRIKEKHDDGG